MHEYVCRLSEHLLSAVQDAALLVSSVDFGGELVQYPLHVLALALDRHGLTLIWRIVWRRSLTTAEAHSYVAVAASDGSSSQSSKASRRKW